MMPLLEEGDRRDPGQRLDVRRHLFVDHPVAGIDSAIPGATRLLQCSRTLLRVFSRISSILSAGLVRIVQFI
jgi:hypothetical protein